MHDEARAELQRISLESTKINRILLALWVTMIYFFVWNDDVYAWSAFALMLLFSVRVYLNHNKAEELFEVIYGEDRPEAG